MPGADFSDCSSWGCYSIHITDAISHHTGSIWVIRMNEIFSSWEYCVYSIYLILWKIIYCSTHIWYASSTCSKRFFKKKEDYWLYVSVTSNDCAWEGFAVYLISSHASYTLSYPVSHWPRILCVSVSFLPSDDLLAFLPWCLWGIIGALAMFPVFKILKHLIGIQILKIEHIKKFWSKLSNIA